MSDSCTATCSKRMECRSSDIKIFPPLTLKETGALVSQTSKYPYVFVKEDIVDRVCDSFCSSSDKSIKQASNDIPFEHVAVHM
ncbi:hypothetical protein TNCV_100241 [Trichonephila clavipes]|nr:hypothetical protein TNCV_100241 [Trichonephila clavipes]